MAVFLGLNLKILNLALPIFVPSKSPKEDIKPPSKSKKIIKSSPDSKKSNIFSPMESNSYGQKHSIP